MKALKGRWALTPTALSFERCQDVVCQVLCSKFVLKEDVSAILSMLGQNSVAWRFSQRQLVECNSGYRAGCRDRFWVLCKQGEAMNLA